MIAFNGVKCGGNCENRDRKVWWANLSERFRKLIVDQGGWIIETQAWEARNCGPTTETTAFRFKCWKREISDKY